MNQDSPQRALVALSKRSQASQQLLTCHIEQTQNRPLEAQNQIGEIETRLERILIVLLRPPDGEEPGIENGLSLLQKLDLLEQSLERTEP